MSFYLKRLHFFCIKKKEITFFKGKNDCINM